MLPFAMPRRGWYAIGAALAALTLWLAITAYGNSRYKAGVSDTDAKWEEASANLRADAAASATKADDAAVKRLEEHVAQASEDAAAVEKAKAEGRSPLDALFGG